jgi:hypothetical protein
LGIALSANTATVRVATPTQAPRISKKTVRMFELPSPLGLAIPPLWLVCVAERAWSPVGHAMEYFTSGVSERMLIVAIESITLSPLEVPDWDYLSLIKPECSRMVSRTYHKWIADVVQGDMTSQTTKDFLSTTIVLI